MIDNVKEEWKKIIDFDDYEISSYGRIRNIKTGNIKKVSTGRRGYPVVSLRKNKKTHLKTIHRLIAIAFIPNEGKKNQINHIDGNKGNFNIDNLEWCTAKENLEHARRTGLHKSDGDKAVVQLKDKKIIAEYRSASEASRKTGISRGNICSVCNNRVRKDGVHILSAGGYKWVWKISMQ